MGSLRLTIFLTPIVLAAPTWSAEPFLEQTDVYVAGRDDVFQYRIPALVTTTKGTLIAACDARKDRSFRCHGARYARRRELGNHGNLLGELSCHEDNRHSFCDHHSRKLGAVASLRKATSCRLRDEKRLTRYAEPGRTQNGIAEAEAPSA